MKRLIACCESIELYTVSQHTFEYVVCFNFSHFWTIEQIQCDKTIKLGEKGGFVVANLKQKIEFCISPSCLSLIWLSLLAAISGLSTSCILVRCGRCSVSTGGVTNIFEYAGTPTGVDANDCDVDGVGAVCCRASLHNWAADVLRSITCPSIPSVSAKHDFWIDYLSYRDVKLEIWTYCRHW